MARSWQQVLDDLINKMMCCGSDWEKPWMEGRMPWQGQHNVPVNVKSGNPYSGINRLILWASTTEKQYQSNYWGTFNQWRSIRSPVAKGEKATILIRPVFEKNYKNGTEPKYFKTIAAFNGDQVLNRNEDHPDLFGDKAAIVPSIEYFVDQTGACIEYGSDRAVYFVNEDMICMPHRSSFIPTKYSTATQAYYATLLHELVHWSGHKSRMNRDSLIKRDEKNYAFEELVAELGSAFLCSDFCLFVEPRLDHAIYLNSWFEAINNEPKVLWKAASQAGKGIEYLRMRILGSE